MKELGIVKRYEHNPILDAARIPYDASLVMNAGVCKFHGKYVMVFRNDVGFSPNGYNETYTNLGIAFSDDGIHWTPNSKPWAAPAEIMAQDPDMVRFYDPRLTVIDGRCYVCFAVDTWHGVRGGVAVTDDFEHLELLSFSAPDNRNMVLFPEKINGLFVRLERPFPVYGRGGEFFDIWASASPDCRFWGNTKLVLGGEKIPYTNSKIGPAAPPVKTKLGWLTLFHTVVIDPNRPLNGWEKSNDPKRIWTKEYMAGVMLLDLQDPTRILGMAKAPLMCPQTPYELDGYRGSVIFPGGMVLEDDGEVKIYYGAADTVECLATANVDDLVQACME